MFRLEGSLPRNSLLSITDCEFTLTDQVYNDGYGAIGSELFVASVLLNYPYGDPFALSRGSSIFVSENRIYFNKQSTNAVNFATLMSSGSITIEESATLNVSSNVLLAANNVSSYTSFRMGSRQGISLEAYAAVVADHNIIGGDFLQSRSIVRFLAIDVRRFFQ